MRNCHVLAVLVGIAARGSQRREGGRAAESGTWGNPDDGVWKVLGVGGRKEPAEQKDDAAGESEELLIPRGAGDRGAGADQCWGVMLGMTT